MSVIISESAFRQFIREALDGRVASEPLTPKQKPISDPVTVNPEVENLLSPDPPAGDEDFEPHTKLELQRGVSQMLGHVKDSHAEEVFDSIRDVLETELEKQGDEEDGSMSKAEKNLKPNPTVDANVMAGGMNHAKSNEGKIRQMVQKIIAEMKRGTGGQISKLSPEVIQEATDAYTQRLVSTGKLNSYDVELAKINPQIIQSLKGFSEFLPQFVKQKTEGK